MKAQERKEKPTRKEELKDKKSIKPQFRKSLRRRFSIFEKYEDWADIQMEEDLSNFTGDGPYYEIDEEEDRIH